MLTTATLIHCTVSDLLHQNKFSYAHFPELVDLAVVVTGLGMLQNNISFVKTAPSFWDSAQWSVIPRPFLDCQSLAYANAITAWIRSEQNPDWAGDLPSEVKRPMQKSLKYLLKTNDSFFRQAKNGASTLDQSQREWWAQAESDSASEQIIALKHLEFTESLTNGQEELLIDRLRSANGAIMLQAIGATERMKVRNEAVVDELRALAEFRDDEVRAKAMCALAKLGNLDERTIDVAAKMLDSRVRFVAYSGLLALASLGKVPDHVLAPANRGLIHSLQTCNYEFVGLFTAAFARWLEDPKAYFEKLLAEDSPDYLQIVLESLKNVREQMVALGKQNEPARKVS